MGDVIEMQNKPSFIFPCIVIENVNKEEFEVEVSVACGKGFDVVGYSVIVMRNGRVKFTALMRGRSSMTVDEYCTGEEDEG